MMRWPWQKRETRESGGDFSDAVVRLLESQAAGTAADASSTAAVEAASGALSRAFAAAEVVGPAWVQDAVTPGFLSQVGRDLIRKGDSMHVIRLGIDGAVKLIAASSWHFEGNHDPDSWTVRATCLRADPRATTWNLPASACRICLTLGRDGWPTLRRDRAAFMGAAPRQDSDRKLNARLADEAARTVGANNQRTARRRRWRRHRSACLAEGRYLRARAARHCLSKPLRPDGIRARRHLRKRIGGQTDSGRHRPMPWHHFAKTFTSTYWPLVVYRLACFSIVTALRSAKVCADTISELCYRSPG